MVRNGWLGKKSGLGFYNYKSKRIGVNKDILQLQSSNAEKQLDDQTIEDRAILIMINEAARCLEEGVVDNAGYLDMAMVMGTGFPPFRGGLMRYADEIGIHRIITRLGQLQKEYGERFAPCELFAAMANKKESFYANGGTS